jgi:LysM repeat protein
MITPTPAARPIDPVIPTPTPSTYTIRTGDTLSQIAQRYGLTVDDIITANPGIDTQILSIGQQIQIPARSESPAFSPPPPDDLATGPLRCIASGAGMWCLASASNPHNQPVENVIAYISLFSADASPLEGSEALLPLNILPAGASLPLAAFFPNRPVEPFSARLEITTAILLAPNDPRYLPASVDNLLIQISADGLSARVNGRIVLPQENPPAAEIWLAGVAYNESGQIIGFRRWQSSMPLAAGESQTFSMNVYSLDGFIDRLEVYVEARP